MRGRRRKAFTLVFLMYLLVNHYFLRACYSLGVLGNNSSIYTFK